MPLKLLSVIIVFLLIGNSLHAQKPITLEDIWQKYTYTAKSVPGFNFRKDGRHYTRLEDNVIKEYDLTTGQFTKDILDAKKLEGLDGAIDNYSFSEKEDKILLSTKTEPIYRRSSKANYYIWDSATGKATLLSDKGKQSFAAFDPDGTRVGFVFENDLFYKDLASGRVIQVTTDGVKNRIINGGTDWVYEEEFGYAPAFWWSGDGKKIAYQRFDESRVKEFTLQKFNNDVYPENVTFKYPKVGEENAVVTVYIYNVETGRAIQVETGRDSDIYIPRVVWTHDAEKVCIFKMNRHQNDLELLLADATTGRTNLLMHESNKYYIDISDDLTFLEDGRSFIWTSEKSGFNHIYLYDMNGKEVRALTKGNYDVTGFFGVDEKRKQVYYQAAKKSPVNREIYSVGLDGSNEKVLQGMDGTNNAQFSSTFDYYTLTFSTINTPPTYIVYDNAGNKVRAIEENAKLAVIQKDFGAQPVSFFNFTTSEGVTLNGWMMKPPKFKKNKKYPVFMFQYGGPGSQEAVNSWRGQNYWWFQMLAQKGYIVACVDNRGTGARGEQFRKMTYLQMGHYETIDQTEAAKWLGKQAYVDKTRIGIFGWSYGGYMSSLCLLKSPDVFKAAIAVAPVTNWKWYDSIYTERYMRTEKENPSGYADNSPVNFADQLKGNYLIVHGLGDDNVHFQNSAEMVNALIKANKQFDTYYYPNRNHGISGGNTRLHLYTKMTDFVMTKL